MKKIELNFYPFPVFCFFPIPVAVTALVMFALFVGGVSACSIDLVIADSVILGSGSQCPWSQITWYWHWGLSI